MADELLAEIRREGDDHTRQLQRDIRSILIAVEFRRAAFAMVCRLPLIVALDLQVEELAAAERVAPRDAEHGTRAEAVVGLSGDIALEVDVVRLVKDQVHAHVERVGAPRSVAWREVDVDSAEQTCRREVADACLILGVAVGLSGEETVAAEDDGHAQGRVLAVVVHGDVSPLLAVHEAVTIVFVQVDVYLSDGPFALSHAGCLLGEL